MNLSRYNSVRVYGYFWDENNLLIYHKNGIISEFSFELNKFIGKLKVSNYYKSVPVV